MFYYKKLEADIPSFAIESPKPNAMLFRLKQSPLALRPRYSSWPHIGGKHINLSIEVGISHKVSSQMNPASLIFNPNNRCRIRTYLTSCSCRHLPSCR